MHKVSLGLAVYNGEPYLAQTLDALLGQTFGDLELIVSDNASTDGTQDIVSDRARRDHRIRYRRNTKNIGALPNLNQTLHMASGDYFKFCGHDDLIEPSYLEKCVAVLDRDPGIVLAHSKVRMIDGDGADLVFDPAGNILVDRQGTPVIEPPDANYGSAADPVERFRAVLANTVTCHFALGLLRRSAVAKNGGFGLFPSSDRALLAELALYGRFAELPEKLFLKREHPRNSRALAVPERQLWAAGRVSNEKYEEYKQLIKAIAASPVSLPDKARCLAIGISKVARRVLRRGAKGREARPGTRPEMRTETCPLPLPANGGRVDRLPASCSTPGATSSSMAGRRQR